MKASEAQKIALEAEQKQYEKELKRLIKKIEFLTGRGKFKFFHYEPFCEKVKTELEQLGYKVKSIQDRNETLYEISWE